jgi:hypothetical protein
LQELLERERERERQRALAVAAQFFQRDPFAKQQPDKRLCPGQVHRQEMKEHRKVEWTLGIVFKVVPPGKSKARDFVRETLHIYTGEVFMACTSRHIPEHTHLGACCFHTSMLKKMVNRNAPGAGNSAL